MKSFGGFVLMNLIRFRIMIKRLFKDRGFVTMLIMVPVLVFAIKALSHEKSGIIRIALVNEDPGNKRVEALIEELNNESKVVYYITGLDENTAVEMVEKSEADAAWVFPKDIEKRISSYVSGSSKTIIRMYEQENNIYINLAREKAFISIFKDIVYHLFYEYSIEEIGDIPETEIEEAYYEGLTDESLFDYRYASGEDANELVENVNYISDPIRGFLAIYIFFAGMVVSLIVLKDKRFGALSKMTAFGEAGYGFLFRLSATLVISITVWLSYVVFGVTRTKSEAGYELILLIFYALGCCAVASLLGEIFTSSFSLCSVAVILSLSAFVICPVILRFYKGWAVVLYPTKFYLEALRDAASLKYLPIQTLCYMAVCIGLVLAKTKLVKRDD